MTASQYPSRTCGTTTCGGREVPGHLTFCDGCHGYLRPGLIGRWLSNPYTAFAAMVLIFAIEGYTSLAIWPVFFFLGILFLHTILAGTAFYRPQRTVFAILAVTTSILLLFGCSFRRLTSWIEIIAASSIVVILLIRDLGSTRIASLSLLATAWLFAEIRAREISPEIDIAVAIHNVWRHLKTPHTADNIFPSLATLVATRFYWLFLGTAVAVGVNARKCQIGAIRVPEIVLMPHKRFRLIEIVIRPKEIPNKNLLDNLVVIAMWIVSYIFNVGLRLIWYIVFVIGNAASIVVDCVAWLLNQALRMLLYIGRLFLQIGLGVAYTCWLSVRFSLVAIAISCLTLFIPLLVAAFSLREFALAGVLVSGIIHHRDLPLGGLLTNAFCIAMIFTVGVSAGIWAMNPRGLGPLWWRDVLKTGLDFGDAAERQLRLITMSDMNYLRAMAISLLPAYFFALLGYDILGALIGGPYRFGYLFWTCLCVLVSTFLMNLALGRFTWRLVRR